MSDLCKYGTEVLENNVQLVRCTIVDSYCAFFRFCPNDWCLKMTPASNDCIQKKIHEQGEAFMKSNENIVEETKVVEKKIEQPIIESTTKKYTIIAIKETFMVLEDKDGNIKSVGFVAPMAMVGATIEF